MGVVASGVRAEPPGGYVRPLFGAAEGISPDSVFWDASGRYFTGMGYPGGDDLEESQLWGMDTQTGIIHQIGLHGDGIHFANGLALMTPGAIPNNAGWVPGIAYRNDGGVAMVPGGEMAFPSMSAWVANLNTGDTRRVGLYTADYQLPNAQEGASGPAYVNLALTATNAGKVLGLALTNATLPMDLTQDKTGEAEAFSFGGIYGQAVWIADAVTGETGRFGLLDATHTAPTVMDGSTVVVQGGYQVSVMAGALTESGFLAGYAMNYQYSAGDEQMHIGTSTWVGNAATGGTYEVGLTDPGHTHPAGTRESWFAGIGAGGFAGLADLVSFVTEDGYVAGNTINYGDPDSSGLSAWVAGYDAGTPGHVTTRVGFFGTDESGIYRSGTGREESEVTHFTGSGLAGGYSEMLGLDGAGRASWVVNAHTLVTTQVGFTGGGYEGEGGYRETYLDYLNNAGVAAGTSALFHAEGGLEDVAWVQKVASSGDADVMAAARIGLVTEAGSTQREADIKGLTESGIVYGVTRQELAGGALVQDAWVAYQTGVGYSGYTTDQVGLTGAGYSDPGYGDRSSSVNEMNAAGAAVGETERYHPGIDSETSEPLIKSETATWIATRQPSASYVTTRTGLFDAAHTSSDGGQVSAWWYGAGNLPRVLSASGYAAGYSVNYGLSDETGQSAWVVSADDAATRRVGMFDAAHTRLDSGIQNSHIEGMTESGYVWGNSDRYDGTSFADAGQTAWVYSFSNDTLYDFDLLIDADGYAFSAIYGVTEDGLAYGVYSLGGCGCEEGFRAFGWTLADGVFVLEDVVITDPDQFEWYGVFATESGEFIGITAAGDVFITTATAVPEPSSLAALAGAALLGFVAVRRRRDRK